MHLGSWWSSCELDDVKACHILGPGGPWISLNTAWLKSQLESVCESRHSKSPAKQAQAPGCERWSCLVEPQSCRTVLSKS